MDNGSTHNFLNFTLVEKLILPQFPNSHTYIVSLINGDVIYVWDKAVMRVQLKVQGHIRHLVFHVMHMSRVDVVLGHEWLHALVSYLQRRYQHNTLAFNDNGVHVLLMGEQDVLASPLTCSVNLTYQINNNEMSHIVWITCSLHIFPPVSVQMICL